ncbi:MAG: glycosyltransferase family 2 protein [Anaerolineaceae bacterium]|nr:glycosyltransferase family 2 protein [Betaproteobacteria bacterium]
MARSRVGIVIPAFNESETIVGIVEAAGIYGVPIVVDDGSTDATAELALCGGAVVVAHGKNCGYDAALNSGFKKAAELGSEIIVTVDADGQHDPLLIQKFIDAIDAGADIVVGIRSRRQRFAEHLFAGYTNLRFGIKDPLCGMKAYRIKVYKALGHFDSHGLIGTELMVFAAKKGFRLSQISFDVRERDGLSRFGQMLTGNYKIIRAMMISIWRVK